MPGPCAELSRACLCSAGEICPTVLPMTYRLVDTTPTSRSVMHAFRYSPPLEPAGTLPILHTAPRTRLSDRNPGPHGRGAAIVTPSPGTTPPRAGVPGAAPRAWGTLTWTA